MNLLFENVGQHQRQYKFAIISPERECMLVSLSDIGMKRGRCCRCQVTKREPPCCMSFDCGVCGVRPCRTSCFSEFSQVILLE